LLLPFLKLSFDPAKSLLIAVWFRSILEAPPAIPLSDIGIHNRIAIDAV